MGRDRQHLGWRGLSAEPADTLWRAGSSGRARLGPIPGGIALRTLVALAALALLTAPLALAEPEAAPASARDLVQRLLRDRFGELPAEADARLALLDAFRAPRGPVASGAPAEDTGLALGGPCAVSSGGFIAVASGYQAVRAMENMQSTAQPVGACAPGARVGTASGDITDQADYVVACIDAGTWTAPAGTGCRWDPGSVAIAGLFTASEVEFCYPGLSCLHVVSWNFFDTAVTVAP